MTDWNAPNPLYQWTCGVDEAGRGPLAGSVVAATSSGDAAASASCLVAATVALAILASLIAPVSPSLSASALADCAAFSSAFVGGLDGSLPNLSSATPGFGDADGVPGGFGFVDTLSSSGTLLFVSVFPLADIAFPLVARLPG